MWIGFSPSFGGSRDSAGLRVLFTASTVLVLLCLPFCVVFMCRQTGAPSPVRIRRAGPDTVSCLKKVMCTFVFVLMGIFIMLEVVNVSGLTVHVKSNMPIESYCEIQY